MSFRSINPLSAKFVKWSNTLKQIVGKLPTICLSVFDHSSGLAFKGLKLTHHFISHSNRLNQLVYFSDTIGANTIAYQYCF